MTAKREFDLVIFGASGFTGFFMVRELLQTITSNPTQYSSLKWAIAGKNTTKLDDTLVKLAQELNVNLSKVSKIKADVNNTDSLLCMVKRTSVIVNAVGPFQLYGRQVVEASLQAGTHYIDVSCELLYVEGLQLELDTFAREKGTLIITNCGFGSIPADIGVCFLKEHFERGKLYSVESYCQFYMGQKGYTVNFGTLHSGMHLITSYLEYLRVHTRLYSTIFSKPIPKPQVTLPMHLLPFKTDSGWNVPYLAGDKETVERSQRYNYQFWDEKPVQFQPYLIIPNLLLTIAMLFFGLWISILTVLKPTRLLLERWPDTFTLGFFTKSGPTREQIETSRFEMRFVGKGWTISASDDPHSEPSRPFDKELTLLISGCDAAYKTTATCAIQAGLTVLSEREIMPRGGVFTPGSAFRNTKLVDRLQMRDIKFEFL